MRTATTWSEEVVTRASVEGRDHEDHEDKVRRASDEGRDDEDREDKVSTVQMQMSFLNL